MAAPRFAGIEWNRQNIIIGSLGLAVVILIVWLIFFTGGGEKATPPAGGGAPVPQGGSQPAQPATQPLLENLKAISARLGVQVFNTSPKTLAVDTNLFSVESRNKISEEAKKEFNRDAVRRGGKKAETLEVHAISVVLSPADDCITGYVVQVKGKLEGGEELALTDVYIGDASWTPQSSSEWAAQKRKEAEAVPLGGLQGAGGHRIPLDIVVPTTRPVATND